MDPLSIPPTRGPQLPTVTANSPQAETARQFEAVFLGQICQLMLENAGEAGEFSGGHGEQVFRGVLAEKMGNEMARRGGVGIAPVVLDQIIRLQQGDGM